MSSIELLALALAAAAPTGCPAADGGVRLTDATVYDGPIADNAILAPERERRVRGGTVNEWPVRYVYQAGREVVLECRYAQRPPVVVRVARPVGTCRYTAVGRSRAMTCR
jgi:hypothetical protein